MTKETAVVPWHQNQKQLNLLKRTFAEGATTDEFALFVGVAKRCGLDPFSRQIHMVKRAGKVTVQCGIDGYRAIAVRSGDLAGIDDATYDSEDNATPKKATVTVWRMIGGQRVSFTASARWSEYFPGDKTGFMWKKMPYLMLAKCAEALALRKAFPNDLSGLYTTEEMGQADIQPTIEMEIVEATEDQKDKTAEIEARTKEAEPSPKEMIDEGQVIEAKVVEEPKTKARELMEEGLNKGKKI